MIEEKLSQIRREGISDLTTVDKKLLYACNAWAAGARLVQAHPDARDMFDLGFKSVCVAYQAFRRSDCRHPEGFRAPIAACGFSGESWPRSIVYALKGFTGCRDQQRGSSSPHRHARRRRQRLRFQPLSKNSRTRPK